MASTFRPPGHCIFILANICKYLAEINKIRSGGKPWLLLSWETWHTDHWSWQSEISRNLYHWEWNSGACPMGPPCFIRLAVGVSEACRNKVRRRGDSGSEWARTSCRLGLQIQVCSGWGLWGCDGESVPCPSPRFCSFWQSLAWRFTRIFTGPPSCVRVCVQISPSSRDTGHWMRATLPQHDLILANYTCDDPISN